MPILWRYLLRNYLQVFALNVAGFISILLVTRFQTIARFAAASSSKLSIFKFVLQQIPFILPLALPISCLIAALILFRRMSHSGELTALRISGLGILTISFPLITCGLLMGMLNFTIVSEIAPPCRALSKGLAYQMIALNPLSLFQKETLIKLKNTYVDIKVLKSGKYAEDVCFITKNLSNQRLGLMIAKKLSLKDQKLSGKDVTFISSITPKNLDSFDHLVIENQAEMETHSDQVTQYLRSSDWNFNYDYLNLRMLQAKNKIENGKDSKFNSKMIEEVARRISLGLAAFTFTLTGIAFGIDLSRTGKYKKILMAMALLVFYLICFIAAKSIKHNGPLSTSFLLIPHIFIFLACIYSFKQIAKGVQ